MKFFMKSLLFMSFLSLGFLNAITTEFKLENKTNDKVFIAFGTSQFFASGMNFVPVFPKEVYTQNVTLESKNHINIMLSKTAPVSGKTKVLNVDFSPNKNKISVVVKDSTKNAASGLEVASSSIISGSGVAKQSDVLYEKSGTSASASEMLAKQQERERAEREARLAQERKTKEDQEAAKRRQEEEKKKQGSSGPRAWYTLLDQRSMPSDAVIVGFKSSNEFTQLMNSNVDDAADALANKLQNQLHSWSSQGFKKRQMNATDAEAKTVLENVLNAGRNLEQQLKNYAMQKGAKINPKYLESISGSLGAIQSTVSLY